MSGQLYDDGFDRFFILAMYKVGKLFGLLLIAFAMSACDDTADVSEVTPYEGALFEIENMETLYSDSAVVRVRVKAKRQLEFENGDREFPEGVYIEFYDVTGKISTTLEANKGHFDNKENLYTATGDVEVNNFVEDQKLNTEVLYWKQDKEEIYTDKFVRIETAEDILLGEGLTANQDFSSYRILKPTGELSILED